MKRKWWKEAIGYQIYPRSFMDSNGDGIGDIPGIISKLDYLKDLGIDVIWVCPFYKSPNDDNGYDISDYKEIMSDFGTINDFDNLLREVHNRGMKLIIDLVVNHTSDEHPWFIESKSSKDNPKRDWYIWREGKDGKEPNNWESIFKGSAWELDEKTEEYYLHLFTKKQPDLNWENKDVRNEIYNMINWWLDKGIDGFRVDAISHIKKEPGLKDMPNPNNERYVSSFDKHMNVEGVQDFLKELKENTFDKYDIMTVGEANGVSTEDAEEWVGEENGKFSMVFQFEHLDLWNNANNEKFNAKQCKEVLSNWQIALEEKGWNALFIENHDITRVVSSWGNDKDYWRESSKALGLMYFMQKGTPFIYQGQEIGMTNVKFKSIDEYNDVKGINYFKENIENGMSEDEALRIIRATSRDNTRTPMQWDSTKNAGFTYGTPWIGVTDNYKNINVEIELNDDDSILNFYKKMIKLKKERLPLIYGKYNLILEEDEDIYAYERILDNDRYIIITNLSENNVIYSYKNAVLNSDNLLLSNYQVKEHKDSTEFDLRPYEARLYKVK
ncbi:glycoside hydrolase family 13 protein [Clostridium septicum]|uniref:Alpha-amylase n=1 Tax=Clostridium septicum TaxID=1504 RepID=A0A9N7PK35_CLOSE|nr:alpha-glucosidase [Clostridium septicum]AYE33627.1 alpha-glucosidase [Clostridium septicum]MDU1312827.1 alpha-glucosidase [Clostridium septicum]QAS61791.1 alpha-glucosidase [Clostridium septicum]UEC21760.1 alpha-glucosidase [Clostridium septicum]USS00187.1 alpha-glucosidase [Clostridium septicum]